MSSFKILGVMTGTSCDALDAACIEVSLDGWAPLWTATSPYPAKLRKDVLDFQKPRTKQSAQHWLDLHRSLGDWYGKALKDLIRKNAKHGIPDVIANHGQTIAHFPAALNKGLTLQMGDPTRIAQATGLTVVSNFREGDMAAGGQGAPLVPLFHKVIAESLGQNTGIAIHNVGGISNLTYIGPDEMILAFDTGPGNIWMDAAAEFMTRGKSKFDKGGKLALQGEMDWKAVDRVLKHPYFRKKAPKSTGRDDFPFEYFFKKTKARGVDLVATATAVTVESIAQAYEQTVLDRGLPLSQIFFCGGGSRNPALLYGISQRLPSVTISTLEEAGFDSQFVEAQAFAFYGFVSLLGKPLGGAWTGAKGFGPPGHIVAGENWDAILAALSKS